MHGKQITFTFEASDGRSWATGRSYWEIDLGSTGEKKFQARKQFSNRIICDEEMSFSSLRRDVPSGLRSNF